MKKYWAISCEALKRGKKNGVGNFNALSSAEKMLEKKFKNEPEDRQWVNFVLSPVAVKRSLRKRAV